MRKINLYVATLLLALNSSYSNIHHDDLSEVQIKVDWDEKVGSAGENAYSINAFHSFNPAIPANEAYQKNISYMNPGSIRYHSSSIVSDSKKNSRGWLDHEARAWDVDKIKEATKNWPKDAGIKMTVHAWPNWMREGDERLLNPEYVDDYVQLLAQLVRILNVDLGLGVKYWEPMNERELAYVRALKRNKKPARYHELIDIYNRSAIAMKAVDPNILVGGPAISSAAWVDLIGEFIDGAGDNIDFFSCHFYVTDNPDSSDDAVYDSAYNFGKRVSHINNMLRKRIPDRDVGVTLNEFNIAWNWRSKDPRMINHKGAVFDALVMVSVISSGGESTYAWNDVDNIYGKMSRSYELRPSAHLYHLLNGSFIGDIISTESSSESTVVPFAVVDPQTAKGSIMLINRSDAPQYVWLRFGGENAWSPDAELERHEISAGGYTVKSVSVDDVVQGTLMIPEHSVTVLRGADSVR